MAALPFSEDRYAVVPSTLTRDDQRVTAVRSALRHRHIRGSVLIPRSVLASAAPALFRHARPRWTRLVADARAFRLDTRLLATPYVTVVPVGHGARLGPFVLDLPSRFLHPFDRARMITQPDRQQRIADIAAPALPLLSLICTQVAGGWLTLATTDAIAAELCALTLAERFLDHRLELQGPWEDPTVQRAAELELGARIPQEIEVQDAAAQELPREASMLLEQLAHRLDIAV